MKKIAVVSACVVLIGLVALALAPAAGGQRIDRVRELRMLSGGGREIGVSIRDVESSDNVQTGVVVDDVRAESPADRAGVKRLDVIIEFDGERVRSATQFSRLVRESVPGRMIKATLMRAGEKKEIQITPSQSRGELSINGDRLRERIGDLSTLADRLPPFNLSVDVDAFGRSSRSRLGATIVELTTQLAQYFGAKEGVLVTGVANDAPAARAGLKAGDVITSINGQPVRSRADLMRGLRDAESKRDAGDVTLGVVRDKKEMTVKVTIEPSRRSRTV